MKRPSPAAGGLTAHAALAAAERLPGADGQDGEEHGLAAGLLRLHADRLTLVERERALTGRFGASHPDVPTAVLPALSTDVHDLDGLRRIGDLLAAQTSAQGSAQG